MKRRSLKRIDEAFPVDGGRARRTSSAELLLKRIQGGRVSNAMANLAFFAKRVVENPEDEVSIDKLGEEYAHFKEFVDALWDDSIKNITRGLTY